MKESTQHRVFLCVSALVGCMMAEGAARLTTRHVRLFDVEMARYAALMKADTVVPGLQFRHKPLVHATLMGVRLDLNSAGLRDRERPLHKPVGTRRIMMLGDSITLGWGVEEGETFTARLERVLRSAGEDVDVINTGVGNYNTAQEVAYYTNLGVRYEPDIVVLNYFINDAEPTPQMGLMSRCLSHSTLAVVVWSWWRWAEYRLGWKPGYRDYYRSLYRSDRPGWRTAQAALQRLVRACRASGTSVLVALLPELHDAPAASPFQREYGIVDAAATRLGIPVINTAVAFNDVDVRQLWVAPDDAHPNAAGHERIARALLPAVRQLLRERRRAEGL